jgi:hypothetical protein
MLSFCNHHSCRCDADPAALAKYVLALVKKDKPVTELRSSMVEQLDVFLQSGMFCICLFAHFSDSKCIFFFHKMHLIVVSCDCHLDSYFFLSVGSGISGRMNHGFHC